MATHPAIDKWGQKKYDKPEGTQFEIEAETYTEGYCETCSYTTTRIVVRAKTPKDKWFKDIGTEDNDLAGLLGEILEANK